MDKVYIETSIVSFSSAWPSRDIELLHTSNKHATGGIGAAEIRSCDIAIDN